MLKSMNEPDAVWSELLAGAMEKAKAAGRPDIEEYLSLRAGNDALRNAGVEWLTQTMTQIAEEAARRSSSSFTVDQKTAHSFPHRGANMSGPRLQVRFGVRCLTLEAGWTRTPGDGFMRGGVLAAARISHFGMNQYNTELVLKSSGDQVRWHIWRGERLGGVFTAAHLMAHFALFTGE